MHTTARPSVFFYLKDIRQEPYYYPILFSFDQAGYHVLLADNLKFIGHSFNSAKFIFDLSSISIAKKPLADTALIITDDEHYFKNCQTKGKAILLKSDWSKQKVLYCLKTKPGIFFQSF